MRTEVKADRGEVASVGLTSTYREDLARAAAAINADELDVVVNVVTQTLLAGRGVILAGNGGSATTSQHIANIGPKQRRVARRQGQLFPLRAT